MESTHRIQNSETPCSKSSLSYQGDLVREGACATPQGTDSSPCKGTVSFRIESLS